MKELDEPIERAWAAPGALHRAARWLLDGRPVLGRARRRAPRVRQVGGGPAPRRLAAARARGLPCARRRLHPASRGLGRRRREAGACDRGSQRRRLGAEAGRVARCRGRRGPRRDRLQSTSPEHAARFGKPPRESVRSLAGHRLRPRAVSLGRASRPRPGSTAGCPRSPPPPRPSMRRAMRCSMSTCAATTCSPATAARCWWIGTGVLFGRSPVLDLAARLPSLACRGWASAVGGAARWGRHAALISGVWAAVVGLPPPETAPTVREIQRRQLEVALAWCERELSP